MSKTEERVILHCDCNSFFASVEVAEDPSLRGLPVAVCGSQDDRHGIVLAKSELAKSCGVVTAETIWSARKKCPDLVIVSPHYEKYKEYSRRVNEIYLSYTDLVEPFSIDESWLDVTGSRNLFGSGERIADEIRRRVREEVGITVSVGVSFNKIFAKIGSDYKKPDATTVISSENFRQIVYPLPIEDMIFVGRKSAEILRSFNIKTIGDLAATSPSLLVAKLGKSGGALSVYARGEDDSPVLPWDTKTESKSIGNGMTFRRDIVGAEEIKLGLDALSSEVGERLRKCGMCCCTVSVSIKDSWLQVISRQKTMKVPSCIAREISSVAFELVSECWRPDRPIRALTVTAMNLIHSSDACGQIGFFDDGFDLKRERVEQLEKTLDLIHGRYGKRSLTTGAIVKNDIGVE